MKDWITRDSKGNVVGKWRRHEKPVISDEYDAEEVDDVVDYNVDYWYDK